MHTRLPALAWLRRSPTTQTVITNYVTLVCGFLASLLLARQLGPSGRGEVTAAYLWPQTLVYLAGFGIEEASLYFSARLEGRTPALLSNALMFALIQCAIIIPLGFLLLPFLLAEQSADVIDGSRLLLATIPFAFMTLYGSNVLRGRLRIPYCNAIQLVFPVSTLLGIVWMSATHTLSLDSVVRLYLSAFVLALTVTLAILLGLRLWSPFRLDWGLAKQMLRFGAKIQPGAISQLANLRLDQMLMAAFLPAAQLGLYTVAVSASSITSVVPSAIRSILTPTVAQGQHSGAEGSTAAIEKRLHRYWLVNAASGLALLLVIPWLLPLIYGDAFRQSVLPAEILVVAAVLLGGKQILTGACYGLGTPFLVSQAEIASLACTVVGLLLLLRPLGIVGAALASLVAYGVSFLLLAYRLHHVHRLSLQAVLVPNGRDAAELARRLRELMLGSRQRIVR
jgi:O-antigen/teichoic acid export membrane protein